MRKPLTSPTASITALLVTAENNCHTHNEPAPKVTANSDRHSTLTPIVFELSTACDGQVCRGAAAVTLILRTFLTPVSLQHGGLEPAACCIRRVNSIAIHIQRHSCRAPIRTTDCTSRVSRAPLTTRQLSQSTCYCRAESIWVLTSGSNNLHSRSNFDWVTVVAAI